MDGSAAPGESAATAEAFRLWLSERLPAEIDPMRVLAIAAEGLGRHLGVARVGYGEIEPGSDVIIVPLDWTDGIASMAGRRPFHRDSAIARHYRAGRHFVVADTATAGFAAAELAELESTDTRSFVGVPLLHDGELVGLFTAIHSAPREWTAEEIALIGHTGARIQGALEHVRTNARLRDSGEQFRTLAQNIPGICWLADPGGRPFWMNERGLAFHGALGADPLARRHPDDAAAGAAWAGALADGTRVEVSARLQGPDGDWRSFVTRAEPIRDETGTVARWCGVQIDLTEQHRREQHERFFRGVSDTIRAETDPGRVLAVVADRLAAHLGVARVIYREAEGPAGAFVVRHDSAGGYPAPPPASTSTTLDALARGETVATGDAAGARVEVPLVKEGALVAILGVHHDAPRDWTSEDVALIEELAERTWSTVTRARAEAALREREQAQAFLIGWSDAIRNEASTRAILATTLDRLGRHLGATRVNYAETDATGRSLEVLQQWGTGDRIVGRPFPFEALGRHVIADHLTGRPLVVADVADHPLFDEENLTIYRATGVVALVSVPLVRDGALHAVLCAQSDAPRRWTPGEVRLIAEVAERTWAVLERARFEERLAESEALLAGFMDNAPVGMHLKDADGRYLRINRELTAAMDLTAAEVIGRHPAELFPAATAERVIAMERQAQGGTLVTAEFVRPPRDRYAAMLSIVFPIKGDGRVATGGFTLDLTDRKAAEAALQRSRDALYQSEKLSALGGLLAGVSHELNNPLAIVVAQAVMMERQARGTELAERAARIRKAADRCARIVQTFLAMARQKPPERSAVDLNAVARAAADLAAYGLGADGVRLVLDLAPDLPRIAADADQLHQVVTNLLVNAQQAMAGMADARRLTLRTGRGETPDTVMLEVADSGPGVPEELRRRIFEPFYTTKAQGEGTGVGLSFSQGLAEAHGGRLALMPSRRGACFRLTLPIDDAPPAPVETTLPPRAAARHRRALVVGGEEEIAAVLADLLAAEGFGCDVVIGGGAAQALLADGRGYDLVVSDLHMPGIDGPALWRWIGERRPDLAGRTAFTTGDTLGAAASRFLADAGRPVLEKPFMPDTIRRFLAQAATS